MTSAVYRVESLPSAESNKVHCAGLQSTFFSGWDFGFSDTRARLVGAGCGL